MCLEIFNLNPEYFLLRVSQYLGYFKLLRFCAVVPCFFQP